MAYCKPVFPVSETEVFVALLVAFSYDEHNVCTVTLEGNGRKVPLRRRTHFKTWRLIRYLQLALLL